MRHSICFCIVMQGNYNTRIASQEAGVNNTNVFLKRCFILEEILELFVKILMYHLLTESYVELIRTVVAKFSKWCTQFS